MALAGAVEAQPLTGGLLGRGASYTSFVPPATATTGCVGLFLGSPLALGCTDMVYTVATKSLDVTDGRVQAANLKAIPLPAPGSVTVTPVLSKIGAITVVAGSALADGDALSVGDGTGVVPMEFDASPGDGTTGGAVPIVFDGTETATAIRDAVKAILDAAGRDWTTSAQGADGIGLVRATPGATGGAITESVTDAGFSVTDWTDPTHATTYTYSLQACLADGTCNAAGAASSTAAGVATLSATNFNRLAWSAVPGAASYKIRRDVGGASQGVIWSGTALTVDDTGLAGDSSAKPATDLTGALHGNVRAGNGSAAAPAIGFANTLAAGFAAPGFYLDAQGINWSISGVRRGMFSTSSLYLVQDAGGFVLGSALDTGAWRGAAKTWLFGAGGTSGDFTGTTKRATDIIATQEGATWTSGFVTELTTIAAAATTDTTIDLPANAVVRAVVGRVTVQPPGTATMTVGDPTTAARFATGISTAAGTTYVGLIHVDQTGAPGPKQSSTAKVRYTPNASPSDATGRIRTTVFYDVFVPPTS